MIKYMLIDFTFIIFALFYLLEIRPTIIRLITTVVFILLPFNYIFNFSFQLLAIFVLILTSILLFYFFNKKIIAIFDVLVVMSIGIFSNNLSQLINNQLEITSFGLQTLWYALCFALIIYLFKTIVKKKLFSAQIPLGIQLLLLFIVMLGLGIFYLNVFFLGVQDNRALTTANFFIQITYLLLILVAITILITNLNKMQTIRQKEIAQQQFLEYTQALEQVNTDMQKFRHDYLNILTSLQTYIEDEDLPGLKQYFYSEIMEMEQQTLSQSKMINTLENLQIVELKGLLSSKLLHANRLKQRITIEIPHTVHTVNMSLIDLTRILGIFIDNAIESSITITDSVVHIAILPSFEASIVIVVSNPIQNATFDISAMFDYQSSTKGLNRGVGLANVKEILQTYHNVTLNTRVEKHHFIQELQIY